MHKIIVKEVMEMKESPANWMGGGKKNEDKTHYSIWMWFTVQWLVMSKSVMFQMPWHTHYDTFKRRSD